MNPLVARLDRFVRWFFNSSPSAMIEARHVGGGEDSDVAGADVDRTVAPARLQNERVFS